MYRRNQDIGDGWRYETHSHVKLTDPHLTANWSLFGLRKPGNVHSAAFGLDLVGLTQQI